MPRVKHFRFEQREIHVGRTFRRASLAGETIAQRSIEFRRAQRIVSVHAEFERGPDDVGASARGHDFFARCDECRAHDRRVLAATGATIALLEIADERAVLKRKGEDRLKWKLEWAREVFAQMIVNPGRDAALPRKRSGAGAARQPYLENFPRIENVFRIESIFDCAHHLEQLVAELLAHVFSAGDADAMLSGERTFELAHERGGLIGDLP